MENFFHLIAKNPLFRGVPQENLPDVIRCLNGTRKAYDHRTLLFSSGEPVPCMGLVLRGCTEIFLSDASGNTPLISQSWAGELFGQALAITGAEDNIYEIYACQDTEILFLYVPEFTSLKNCGCTYRFLVMENLMKLVSKENISLIAKIQILTQGSLRQKLLLYFSVLSKEQRSDTITLPFGREKLSCYLSCDRSAVSRELGRMKKEGLISMDRNTITLLSSKLSEPAAADTLRRLPQAASVRKSVS